MIKQAQRVLDFWFGPLENKNTIPKNKNELWFRNGRAYDEIIRADFLDLHTRACNKELDEWENAPHSLLALIIILDQFSRHIYRDTAQAFAQDRACLHLVNHGLCANMDKELYYIERKFFYMPLMHAEDIRTQELSVTMFQRLLADVPHEVKEVFASTLSFANSHHHVIEQFGRFPELNEILGRESTPEEIAFLESGKYRFL